MRLENELGVEPFPDPSEPTDGATVPLRIGMLPVDDLPVLLPADIDKLPMVDVENATSSSRVISLVRVVASVSCTLEVEYTIPFESNDNPIFQVELPGNVYCTVRTIPWGDCAPEARADFCGGLQLEAAEGATGSWGSIPLELIESGMGTGALPSLSLVAITESRGLKISLVPRAAGLRGLNTDSGDDE